MKLPMMTMRREQPTTTVKRMRNPVQMDIFLTTTKMGPVRDTMTALSAGLPEKRSL